MRKRDEPAYPVTNHAATQSTGLTKLEYTAIQALQGLLASESPEYCWVEENGASAAVKHANAIWDELEKEPGK